MLRRAGLCAFAFVAVLAGGEKSSSMPSVDAAALTLAAAGSLAARRPFVFALPALKRRSTPLLAAAPSLAEADRALLPPPLSSRDEDTILLSPAAEAGCSGERLRRECLPPLLFKAAKRALRLACPAARASVMRRAAAAEGDGDGAAPAEPSGSPIPEAGLPLALWN